MISSFKSSSIKINGVEFISAMKDLPTGIMLAKFINVFGVELDSPDGWFCLTSGPGRLPANISSVSAVDPSRIKLAGGRLIFATLALALTCGRFFYFNKKKPLNGFQIVVSLLRVIKVVGPFPWLCDVCPLSFVITMCIWGQFVQNQVASLSIRKGNQCLNPPHLD